MDLKSHASKFKISTHMKNVQFETDLRAVLQHFGFQTVLFDSKKIDCHVIVLDVQKLSENLSEFIEASLKENPDLQFIFHGKLHQFQILVEYKKYNAFAVLDHEDPFLKEKTIWEIEKACENLYYFYQNEQIYKDYLQTKNHLENTLKASSNLTTSIAASAENLPVAGNPRDTKFLNLIRELRENDDFDQTISYFLTQAPHAKKVYFAFSIQSETFTPQLALGFPLDVMKDLNYQSNESEVRNLVGLKFVIMPEALEKFLVNIFQTPHYVIFPVLFLNQLCGFFIFQNSTEGTPQQEEVDYVETIWPVVKTQLEATWSRRRIADLEVRDSKTHFFNSKYYRMKIKEEMQRAQRMQHPLSILRVSIDDYFEVQQNLGNQIFEEKLRAFSHIVTETGRPHDSACRLSENEFAILLPHCSRKNAAIRAERLRKSLELHEAFKDKLKLNLSFGVSEYPSLCNSIEELEATAAKALKHIQERGGNKVCIFRAPQTFIPAFLSPE